MMGLRATRHGSKRRALVLPVAVIVATELAGRWRLFDSDTLASPSAIAVAAGQALLDGTLLHWTAQTLGSAAAGFFIGASVGLVLGIVLGAVPALNHLLNVSIEAVRPVPAVALIPVSMLIFGLGYRMEFGLVAFTCVWPVLILTRAAVDGVEPRLIEVSRALGMSFVERAYKIIVPASLPRIFVSLRLAAAVAMVVSVTVEVAANPQGLGHGIMMAQESLHADLMFALLIWIGLVGWLVNWSLLVLQARLFHVQDERTIEREATR